MSAVVVTVLAVVVAVEGLLIAGLLRSHAVILRRLHELGAGIGDDAAIGEPTGEGGVTTRVAGPEPTPRTAPIGRDGADLEGTDLNGDPIAVRVVGARHGTVLAFLSSSCLTCAGFWEELRDRRGIHLPEGTRLVVVPKGLDEESPRALADLAPAGVTLVLSSRAWDDYEVPGSPYVVYVDGPSGRVAGEGTGGSWAQVARLLAQATGDLTFTAGAEARRRRRPRGDAEREAAMDDALLRAGVAPGDARLEDPFGEGGQDR